MATVPPAGWVTAAGLAQLFDCTTQTLRDLSKAGIIPKAARGSYPLEPSVKGYVTHLREARKANSQSVADSGLKAAKQRHIDILTAQKLGDLIDFPDVTAAFSQILAGFRAELNGIPAAVSRERKIRASIQKALDDALSRCERRFKEASSALRSGDDVFGADEGGNS